MPLPTGPRPWSFYRLGPTKEKGLFKRYRRTYDGVVVPAHIASYYSAFCSEFVGSLGKPYFIDPLTHIFANDPAQLKRFLKDKDTGRTKRDGLGRKKKGDVKRSYAKLIEQDYGAPLIDAVRQNRSVVPGDFADDDVARGFTQRVVGFQRTKLAAVPAKYKKYAKYAKGGMSSGENPPMCVVAPYFPTRSLGPHGWHGTNLRFVELAQEMADGAAVFAVLLAGTQILGKDIKQLAADYLAAGAAGFLLWPDGFGSEQDRDARAVFGAVKELNKVGKPVILMYGDPFSLVLHYAGLSGFSCGVCYGEQKDSTQDLDVEGAIPPRYYLRRLKKKMVIETEVRRLQLSRYPDLRCDCEICSRKPDPATLDDSESREHFMLVRLSELEELRSGLSKEDFAAGLSAAYQEHQDDPLLRPIERLRMWAALLGEGE